MAKSLNSLGPWALLDEVYQKEGGSKRLVELVYIRKWPQTFIAKEFGFSRDYLNRIIKKIEEDPEDLADTIKKIKEGSYHEQS